MISLILFGLLAVLLLISVPIAISLGIASTVALIVSGKVSASYVPQGLVTSIDSFPLMAVPFFILAGDLMGQGGLSQRLINVGRMFFGRYTGGMAIIAVVTCIFFAAISGSGPATVAAVGAILLPAMARDGYRPSFSSGLVACSGSLGVIIPPSIPMVIYATSANVSVSKMFMAGVVPGLLIGFALIAYAWLQSRKDGQKPGDYRPTRREMLAVLNDAKWALMVPVIILGGIYGGVFTPTEAAAVGVIYGLVVGTLVYRELKLKDLYKIFAGSALTSATIMLIVGTATIFGRALAIEGVPVMLADFITSAVDQAWLLLLAINLILLIVGTFMAHPPAARHRARDQRRTLRHRDDRQPCHRHDHPARRCQSLRRLARLGSDTGDCRQGCDHTDVRHDRRAVDHHLCASGFSGAARLLRHVM